MANVQEPLGAALALLTLASILGGWLLWLHGRFSNHETRLTVLEKESVKQAVAELKEELEWVARLLLIMADREGVDISKIKRQDRHR
jgi:membrane protein YqaA with SNARE-associated domain